MDNNEDYYCYCYYCIHDDNEEEDYYCIHGGIGKEAVRLLLLHLALPSQNSKIKLCNAKENVKVICQEYISEKRKPW